MDLVSWLTEPQESKETCSELKKKTRSKLFFPGKKDQIIPGIQMFKCLCLGSTLKCLLLIWANMGRQVSPVPMGWLLEVQ